MTAAGRSPVTVIYADGHEITFTGDTLHEGDHGLTVTNAGEPDLHIPYGQLRAWWYGGVGDGDRPPQARHAHSRQRFVG